MIATNNDPRTRQPFTWANIGTSFDEDVTLNFALEQGKINYEVAEAPLLATSPDFYRGIKSGEQLSFAPTKESLITTHKAIFRTDTHQILGVVGKDYGIVQNADAFAFVKFFKECSQCEITIKCAGETESGKSFVICQFGEPLQLSPNDVIYTYIVITNSHDGTTPVRVQFCPMRLVCSNGLKIAIKEAKSEIIFKHTKYVKSRIDLLQAENRRRAIDTITGAENYNHYFGEKMLEYKDANLSDKQIKALTNMLFLQPHQIDLVHQNNENIDIEEISTRTKNTITAFENALHYGIGQDTYKGTKLWFLNGITTFLQNGKTYKSDSAKFDTLQFGTGAQKVQSAFALLESA